MRNRAVLLVIFALLQWQSSPGQKVDQGGKILFRGVVFSASSGERLVGSSVFINKTLTGISKADGTFSFFASRHDTIVFDMLGYKSSRLIVMDSLRSNEFLTGVYLQSDTTDIGEVIIIPNLAGLKAEMMNPSRDADMKMNNARSNLDMASYQGRVSEGKLGDPASNYNILRNRQKINAFEKGGIPSDRMVSVNPLLLLPAAAYLLVKGVPEKPAPPPQGVSQKELDELNSKYFELVKKDKRQK